MFNKALEIIVYISYLIILGAMAYGFFKATRKDKYNKYLGITCLFLLFGKGTYLLTRAYALVKGGIEKHMWVIGWTKQINFIISVSFFLMLYECYLVRFAKKRNQKRDSFFYAIAFLSIVIGILPWNSWGAVKQPVVFIVLRRLPMLFLVFLMSLIFYFEGSKRRIKGFVNVGYLFIAYILMSIITSFLPGTETSISLLVLLKGSLYLIVLLLLFIETRDRDLRGLN